MLKICFTEPDFTIEISKKKKKKKFLTRTKITSTRRKSLKSLFQSEQQQQRNHVNFSQMLGIYILMLDIVYFLIWLSS